MSNPKLEKLREEIRIKRQKDRETSSREFEKTRAVFNKWLDMKFDELKRSMLEKRPNVGVSKQV